MLTIGSTNCVRNGQGLLAGSAEDHLFLFLSLSPSSRSNFIRYSWIKLAWPEECAVKASSQWKQKSLCHLLLRRKRYVKISTNKLAYKKQKQKVILTLTPTPTPNPKTHSVYTTCSFHVTTTQVKEKQIKWDRYIKLLLLEFSTIYLCLSVISYDSNQNEEKKEEISSCIWQSSGNKTRNQWHFGDT